VAHEYVGNLHTHTRYSDGHGSHEDIALAAIEAGLDFVIVTDHNVWVEGMDGYRYLDRQRVLLLTGEEIHDQAREPQKNHLLVYETPRRHSMKMISPGLIGT
jgi:predicted metal-dependent phosphoesterase TrpH